MLKWKNQAINATTIWMPTPTAAPQAQVRPVMKKIGRAHV